MCSSDLKGDLKGKFYTFDIGKGETPGTFAKAVGVNGNRGAIVDLYDTDPSGWDKDVHPALKSPADLVIYELHVRDFSISPTSDLKYKGKYLALTEPGAIEYLKNLGINAIYQDGKNADYEKNPKSYQIIHKTVKKGDVLKIKEARGGGFAISLLAK